MAVKTKPQLTSTLSNNITDPLNKQNTASRVREIIQDIIDSMQIGLVSGTNIKTINGNTLLGSGNLVIGSPAIANNYIPKGNGTSITDGTWQFSTNDLLPNTTGSNLGGASNRIGTGYINTINYATDLVFSENGTERGRFLTGGNFGIGESNPAYPFHIKNTAFKQLALYRNTANGDGPSITFNSVGSYGVETEFVRIGGIGNNTDGIYLLENRIAGTFQASMIYREQTTSANGGGLRIQNLSMATTERANAVLDVRTTFTDANNLALFYTNTSDITHWFMNNGNVYLNYNNTGKTVVGAYIASPGAQLVAQGSGATSATYNFITQNSSGTKIIKSRDDGRVGIGTNDAYLYSKLTVESNATSDAIIMSYAGDVMSSIAYDTTTGGSLNLNQITTVNPLVRINNSATTYDYINTGRNFIFGGTDASAGKLVVNSAGDGVQINWQSAGEPMGYLGIHSNGAYLIMNEVSGVNTYSKVRLNGNGVADYITTDNTLIIAGGFGANTIPTGNSNALVDLQSTTKALLLMRMTSTQRDAITATNGMLLYNTTTDKFQGYAGGAWVDLH